MRKIDSSTLIFQPKLQALFIFRILQIANASKNKNSLQSNRTVLVKTNTSSLTLCDTTVGIGPLVTAPTRKNGTNITLICRSSGSCETLKARADEPKAKAFFDEKEVCLIVFFLTIIFNVTFTIYCV